MESPTPYSYHIFLFPFRWYKKDSKYKIPSIKEMEIFEEELKQIGWKSSDYVKFESSQDYNEYQYFYPFVRDVLYDFGDSNEHLIRHLTQEIKKDSKYIIHINKKLVKENKLKDKYELEITSIDLNFYSTGVGILSFHLKNEKYDEKKDVLAINQFGRRIYPSFLGNTGIEFTRERELAQRIEINTSLKSTNDDNITKKYSDLKNYSNILLDECVISDNINCFLQKPHGKFKILSLLDDRMFTISWMGADNELMGNLAKYDTDTYGFEENDFWSKYIFVDVNEQTIWNKKMRKQMLEKQTYARWVEYKSTNPKDSKSLPSPTLYGISRYSFVALSSLYFDMPLVHTKTIYYKMIELSLVQRASVINFSWVISDISKELNKKEDFNKDEIKNRIEHLYRNYIRFINKMYFREITAQEQGIELYDMLQNIMKIEGQVKDLDNEINELHQFGTMIVQENQANETMSLTKVATFFLPAGLIVALLALPKIETWKLWKWDCNLVKPFFVALAFILIASMAFYWLIRLVFFCCKKLSNIINRLKNDK